MRTTYSMVYSSSVGNIYRSISGTQYGIALFSWTTSPTTNSFANFATDSFADWFSIIVAGYVIAWKLMF